MVPRAFIGNSGDLVDWVVKRFQLIKLVDFTFYCKNKLDRSIKGKSAVFAKENS